MRPIQVGPDAASSLPKSSRASTDSSAASRSVYIETNESRSERFWCVPLDPCAIDAESRARDSARSASSLL